MRDKNCNKGFLCRTVIAFRSWSLRKQKAFLDFIDKISPSHYKYSMGMDTGRFLRAFERDFKEGVLKSGDTGKKKPKKKTNK